jgi:copper homeostasis protein
MIRPRGGDFLYSQSEIEIMEDDLQVCLENGADGVVFGCLTDQGLVDKPACKRLLLKARSIKPNCPVTFHRAIDLAASILEAAQDVHELGFDRILTSGGYPTADQGKDVVKDMVQMFKDKGPIIMPGMLISNNLALGT